MVIKGLCKICNKAVVKTHHASKCDKCNIWVHTKCNKINLQTYKFLQEKAYDWFCLKCFAEIIPFSQFQMKIFRIETEQESKV